MSNATAVLAPSLDAACERWPDRPAISYRGEHITYAGLRDRVRSLALAYRRIGIGPGDRVICQLVNCPEHIIAIYAAWACGAIHVGTDNDLVGPELSSLVARTGAVALLFQPRGGASEPLAPVRAVSEAHPGIKIILHGCDPEDDGQHALADLLAGGVDTTLPAAGPAPGHDDTAVLLLTSGTTGEPKLIPHSIASVWAMLQHIADGFGPGPDDVHLMVLPISHGFGMFMSLMALAAGGRLVVLDRFSPQEALRLITDEQVTVLPGTVAHFSTMMDKLDVASHQVHSLRWVAAAAATLPPPLVERMYRDLDVDIQVMYGASEGFITRTTDRHAISRGSIGTDLTCGPVGPESRADGRVVIIDPESHRPVGPGEIGELAFATVRPVGYWGEPGVAADGWYYTGDLGRVDPADGCWFILGRLKDLINRGGMKVAKGEVEAALSRLLPIAEAAVIATPDPVLGEALCACIVPRPGTVPPSLTEVRALLGQSLARHKLPDELCVLDQLPRTKISKVDERALLAIVESAPSRERLRG